MSAAEVQAREGTRRRVRETGTVRSVAGKQSVVVEIERRVLHPRYHKYVSRRSRLMAHDERQECGVGDTVEVVSSRPLSARKRWRVVRVVEKAALPSATLTE